ncbi:calcium homeostasis modulator protein 5 isoform X2 [Ictalurus punctatus]|uniref:Calcium homeostasis modulator protein 5 isoform X2 n=1 Tax=Ictalurus punctatus TaxID=7998 RepID=W5UBN0_ICTPU|nr:calcium homeostasis modulator protein 5 isoform X2 [Ictalurus punctatus]
MIPASLKTTMDSLNAVVRFFTNQKTKIGYGIMAIATIGGERIFTLLSFQCPCNVNQNMVYGLTYLLGPALVLFTVGLFLSTRLWRLYTGCCLNPRKLCPRANCINCLSVLFHVILGALVAPIMWLSIALLNGTFYECAVSGLEAQALVHWFCKNRTSTCRDQLAKVPCQTSNMSAADTKELLLLLHAQSQILGWVLIMSTAVAALVGTCYKNCRSQVSYLQLTFWKVYKEKENEKFDSFADEYSNRLAERNLKSFFENKDPEVFPFPNHKAWEQISTLYTYNRGEQYYSTLQRYVEDPNRDYTPENMPLEMEHSLG